MIGDSAPPLSRFMVAQREGSRGPALRIIPFMFQNRMLRKVLQTNDQEIIDFHDKNMGS